MRHGITTDITGGSDGAAILVVAAALDARDSQEAARCNFKGQYKGLV